MPSRPRSVRSHGVLVALLLLLSLFAQGSPAAFATETPTVNLQTWAVLGQVGADIAMFGTVRPSAADRTVRVQERGPTSWQTVGTAETDESGDFRLEIRLRADGSEAAGGRIFRAVLPADGGQAAVSSSLLWLWVYPPPSAPHDVVGVPSISGTPAVGSTLTADVGQWSPAPTRFRFRWNRDRSPIPSNSAQYVVQPADLGKHLTVSVMAVRQDSTTYRDSPPTPPIARGSFTTFPPHILGRAAVGETLRADISDWEPAPDTATYQWQWNGSDIAGATSPGYTLDEHDANGAISVVVRADGSGMEPATRSSETVDVAPRPLSPSRTFGDVMHPFSTIPLTPDAATISTSHSTLPWKSSHRTRWDEPGAFTHSLTPAPAGTLVSDMFNADYRAPSAGAEYVTTNSTYKNADVRFTVTARRFAVAYRTYTASDAMLWIDGHPVSPTPIQGWDQTGTHRGAPNWIIVTLPERRTVDVRFAGPLFFTGVDTPIEDAATVRATPAPFTLGVLSDSYYESCSSGNCMSRSAAPTLSTLTGYRVWNLAEAATGYVRPGGGYSVPGHEPSPFGSDRRLASLAGAPIDALLISGSVNDGPPYTTTDQAAAVDKLLDDVERLRPDLPVVLAGVEPIAVTRRADRAAIYARLNANVAAAAGRHRNVVGFIDPLTDPWFTGTGTVASMKQDGNQDQYIGSDGAHPTGDGQAYYQGRIVEVLRNLPLPAA